MGKASGGRAQVASWPLFQQLWLTSVHKLAKEKAAPQVAQEFEVLSRNGFGSEPQWRLGQAPHS